MMQRVSYHMRGGDLIQYSGRGKKGGEKDPSLGEPKRRGAFNVAFLRQSGKVFLSRARGGGAFSDCLSHSSLHARRKKKVC